MEIEVEKTNYESGVSMKSEPPRVFDHSDYREYLKKALEFKRSKNPSYSESAFLKQAGFGPNSRGYFGLIVNGKRNLSSKSILGFGQALKLNDKEMSYFENLVHYNQADNDKDKAYYFGRVSQAIRGKETKAYELMRSQYNYFYNWYLVAIKELASFADFSEESDWIIKKLRNKVTSKQVKEALEDLTRLGILVRNESGKLIPSNEVIRFTDSSLNYTTVNNIHTQMLEKAGEALVEDSYEDRSVSCVVLSCDSDDFQNIRNDIREFRSQILNKYGVQAKKVDAVLNLGLQLFHLTPIDKRKKEVRK